jgi:hypothetical protein
MSVGLDMLAEIQLSPRSQAAFDAALATNRGRAHWRARKVVEARELLALAEIAPRGRMRVDYLDLADELRAVIRLDVKVPVRYPGDGEGVRVEDSATLGLVYPEKALTDQLAGFSYLEAIAPRGIFHPAVAALAPFPQIVCLGDLPAGTRVTEIVLLAYSALAMQNLRIENFEALGALNVDAAVWWEARLSQLPLTRRAFLEAESG